MEDPIFATTAEVQLWIPTWASATYNVEAYILEFAAAAESDVNNNEAMINLSDTYATNNTDLKLTAHKYVCLKTALAIVQMDTSGTDIRTAELFMDWATNEIKDCEIRLTRKENIVAIKESS